MRGTLRAQIARAIAGAAIAAACLAAGAALALANHTTAGILRALAGAGAAGVAAALIALPVATIIARRAIRPIDRLAAAAATFAAGDRTARAVGEGQREVRIIAESFNRMAGDVSGALAELSSEEKRKTQFVSDVSHELRTPLTAIRGAAETLLDGEVDPEHQQRFLSTIAREAERLTRLANDLLALQRIEGATGELPFRRVDLREVSLRAVAMLEPLIESRGVLVEVQGDAPRILGDADRIQQVIANLVDNATRMVGEGGHVWVELRAGDGTALLHVVDDGPGIPAADLDRLFDRFYRADTSRTRTSGGAGLGLAIVRAIVAAHGGSVWAENLPTGARLTVEFPAIRNS